MTHAATSRFVSRLTRGTLALILAGGRGSRLKNLTLWRSKPAMPFGGKFRIIDFALSNCMNSGIRRIAVLTQYKAHSLILHMQRGWGFLRGEFGEFVEILPAQQRIESSWYQGTADAVYQNIDIIRTHDPDYILVLGGDHIYKMDYGPMIAFHVERAADCTVGCIEVDASDACDFGVIGVDMAQRVSSFTEKPDQPEAIPGNPNAVMVSMGIYVFNTKFLFEQLLKDTATLGSSHDFGRDILPAILDRCRVFAYSLRDVESGRQGYWRDVGTVDAYWKANIELVDVEPELNLYDAQWPIWTFQEQLPPAKFVFDDADRRGTAVDSMVSGGCIISGGRLRRSLLFSNVRVHSFAELDQAVALPGVDVGERSRVRRAILDEGCRLPPDTVIGEDPALDAERFHVTQGGIVLVTPEMLGQQVHHVR